MRKNDVCTVSNIVLENNYKLTLTSKRLLMLLISRINNGKESEKLDIYTWYTVSVKDYSDMYGIKYETAKDLIYKKGLNQLLDGLFRYETEKHIYIMHWISGFRYNRKDHTIAIRWTLDIIPLISELQKNFTTTKMRYLSKLGSWYSISLYEFCVYKLGRSKKKRLYLELTVEELKKLLCITDEYPIFNNFFTNAVEKQIKEINEKTNLIVSYLDSQGKKVFIKTGKEVTGIGLTLQFKPS